MHTRIEGTDSEQQACHSAGQGETSGDADECATDEKAKRSP
jgi:hypothetical protein